MLKNFRKHYLLVAVLMTAVLLTGCFGGGKTEEFKLDITVTLDGGEGKLADVALLVGTKTVTVGEDGKATATVAKGDVAVKATLAGYVSYDKSITVDEDATVAIELKVVEKPADDEAIKKAVDAVNAAGTPEAFLKALQDPALGLQNVVPAYQKVYLQIAVSGVDSLSALAVTFMNTPEEIQENVVNPGNLYVDDAIARINAAPNTNLIGDIIEVLWLEHEVIGFDKLEIAEQHQKDAIKYLVDLVVAVRPIQDAQELQGLLDTAEELMLAIEDFYGEKFAIEPDFVKQIEKLYKASDLIDALPAYDTRTELQKEVTKEMTALLTKVTPLVVEAEGKVFDADKKLTLKVFGDIQPATVAHKAAADVVVALRPAEGSKLVVRLDAVKKAIESFEAGLIKAVNDAKNEEELGSALTGVGRSGSTLPEQKLFMAIYKAPAFASVKSIQDAYDAVRLENNLVVAVNDEEDDEEMRGILEGLEFARYDNLKVFNRTEVAGRFIAEKPEKPFGRQADVESFLNTTIDKYEALIRSVNEAKNHTEMREALKVVDKNVSLAQAESVYNQRPEEGYVLRSEIVAAMVLPGQ